VSNEQQAGRGIRSHGSTLRAREVLDCPPLRG
jgi:hypothetical protein